MPYRTFIALLLLFLTGCANTAQVHLFTDSTSNTEAEELVRLMDARDIDVSLATQSIPDSISRTTIIVPQLLRDQSRLYELEDVLASAGHQNIDVVYQSSGNHSYTTDHIGVYITHGRPETAAPAAGSQTSGAELVRVYASACESVDAELSLYGNGALMLETFEWNEETNSESSSFLGGSWHAEGDRLTLELENTVTLKFKVSEFEREERVGTYTGIELDRDGNTDSRYSQCDFHYTALIPRRR